MYFARRFFARWVLPSRGTGNCTRVVWSRIDYRAGSGSESSENIIRGSLVDQGMRLYWQECQEMYHQDGLWNVPITLALVGTVSQKLAAREH